MEGSGTRFVAVFPFDGDRCVRLKIALSANSSEKAKANLAAEIPGWDIGLVRRDARAEWNRLFARTRIEGSEEALVNWYTSLYHLYLQPCDYSDVGEKPYYTQLSLWDTFRVVHPWYTLVTPEIVGPTVDSMLRLHRQEGKLPVMSYGGKVGGAIWYQGCANADQVAEYPRLQKILIDAWRERFRNSTMPFVLTQLSAFQTHTPNSRLPDDFWKKQSSPSQCLGFGPFRIMQDTFRAYPGTGVACTIDIGGSSDIHPTNKREVGRRLAHEAMRLAFGRAEFQSGPRAASAARRGSAVVVRFDNAGKGLTLGEGVRDFHPHLFALAGADGKFRWADGRLEDDGSVVVSSPDVPDPMRVQYCVSAYPPGVCFRRADDGIPVYPFDLDLNCMEEGRVRENWPHAQRAGCRNTRS